MRFSGPCIAVLTLCSCVPAFSQNAMLASSPAANVSTATSSTNVAPATNDQASVDYEALRAEVARQNKLLGDKVAAQKALVRKNETILRDAQKMDAANRRLDAERKRLDMANAELDKQRQSLQSSQKPAEPETATVTPNAGGN